MSWETAIEQAANQMLFAKAWDIGQQLRQKVEDLTEHFFAELVTEGIGVEGPPSLGEYTPMWEPLSQDWIDRKDNDLFYLDTGNLAYTLQRKSALDIFGRPQVFLQWDDGERKITASGPAQKFEGVKLTNIVYQIVPFPRLNNVSSAEELVAGSTESKTFFKLTNPNLTDQRPLVTPFTYWYIHVKIKNAIAGML